MSYQDLHEHDLSRFKSNKSAEFIPFQIYSKHIINIIRNKNIL